MVSKIKTSKKNEIFSDKYILILLMSGYLLGVCIGCYFVFSNVANAAFTGSVFKAGYIKSLFFFPCAVILKYSGILSGSICTLTILMGVQNSLLYCNNILNNNKVLYQLILTMLKDTAVLILLILYITIIINQIIHKKYNIKKDIKYFLVYFCGAVIINLSEYILITFIF